MGGVITKLCSEMPDGYAITAGFCRQKAERDMGYPVFTDFASCSEPADVVVDFSNPSSLDELLRYCISRKLPLILCTTGYSDEQLKIINEASRKIPIFRSGNMSLGINLMIELVKKACHVLDDKFNIEIVEKHHSGKVDAPSGTALMLADAASEAVSYNANYVYDRHSVRKKRDADEIGIHSIRGGTIVGEHEVMFAGKDELLEIKHSALSRDVFGQGAVQAAEFMSNIVAPGLYSMSDLISSKLK